MLKVHRYEDFVKGEKKLMFFVKKMGMGRVKLKGNVYICAIKQLLTQKI